jgi:hypothetical protein
MCVREQHRLTDRRDLPGLRAAHPLATWACPAPEGVFVVGVSRVAGLHHPRLIPWHDGACLELGRVVNAHGLVRAKDDTHWKRAVLDGLERRLQASQDEDPPDRLGTDIGLQQSNRDTSRAMGLGWPLL